MDIKNIFNILLLSLSLTTLVITLVSYIIFRLRYSIQKKLAKDEHHLKGHFFKRYAPQLEAINEIKNSNIKGKRIKREIWHKKPIVIFVAIGILFTLLIAGNNFFVYRQELNKRINTAADYRTLLKQGLLKHYDFFPDQKFDSKEYFTTHFLSRQNLLLNSFPNKNVQIFSPEEASNLPFHQQAVGLWNNWLKRFHFSVSVVAKCDQLSTNNLVIVPDLSFTTDQVRECLLRLMNQETPVLITGNIDGKILENEFEIKKEKNPESKQNYPTFFTSENNLEWDIPPGLLTSWFPIEKEYLYFSVSKNALAFQTSFNGVTSWPQAVLPARLVISEKNSKRHLWIALDPPAETQIDQNYIDNILLSSLAWVSKIPLSKVANWKNGHQAASVIAIDSEDKFANLETLTKMIKDSGHPLTAFLVSNLFLENLTTLKLIDASDDLGSHTDDHERLADHSPEQNFQRLQKSRLDIEEKWKNRVTGFRPPEEIYNEETLNVMKQSGYKYVFADQRPLRYSPVLMDQGSFVLFPRVIEDDVLIKRNRMIETPEQVAARLFDQLQTAQRFGGLYIFSLHTHVFGEDLLLQKGFGLFLDKLKTEVTWKTTLRDLAEWWPQKDALVTSMSNNSQNQPTLVVENNNLIDMNDVAIWITPSELKNGDSLKSNEPRISKIQCLEGRCKVTIPHLQANAKISAKFAVIKK